MRGRGADDDDVEGGGYGYGYGKRRLPCSSTPSAAAAPDQNHQQRQLRKGRRSTMKRLLRASTCVVACVATFHCLTAPGDTTHGRQLNLDYQAHVPIGEGGEDIVRPPPQQRDDEDDGGVQRRTVATIDYYWYLWGGIHRRRMCNLVKTLTDTDTLRFDVSDDNGAVVADPPPTNPEAPSIPLIQLSVPCHGVLKISGAGNWMTEWYALRSIAVMGGVDFDVTCTEGREYERTDVLPWLTGYYNVTEERKALREWWTNEVMMMGGEGASGDITTDEDLMNVALTEEDLCTDTLTGLRLDMIYPLIRRDFRRMAHGVAGGVRPSGQDNDHDGVHQQPSDDENTNNKRPLFPGLELDDIAIHLRCGDVFGGHISNKHGLIRFAEYFKYLPQHIQSGAAAADDASPPTTIGIVTQSFHKDQNRWQDRDQVDGCQRATNELVRLIQESYGDDKVQVSIRNGPDETPTTAAARIVLATKASFVSPTSFGIFPLMGAYGTGYFAFGNGGVIDFLRRVPIYSKNVEENNANSNHPKHNGIIREMDGAEVLTPLTIKQIGHDDAIEWLTAEPDPASSFETEEEKEERI